MDLSLEERKRKEFQELLLDLGKEEAAATPQKRSAIYKRIEELYEPSSKHPFRHYYSDIFRVVVQIKRGKSQGDMEYLGLNLQQLRQGYQAKRYDALDCLIDAGPCIQKLYDHVSLDIARLNYMDAADIEISRTAEIKKISDEVHELAPKVEAVRERIKEADTSLKGQVSNLEKALNNAQKEYITILGIFAAIVITFTAGSVFSSSVLQNMHQASIYRIILVTLLIGFVLFNVLYALFSFIEKLVREKENKKMSLFFVVNAIMILLIALTIICWNFGMVEKRNSEIQQITQQIE